MEDRRFGKKSAMSRVIDQSLKITAFVFVMMLLYEIIRHEKQQLIPPWLFLNEDVQTFYLRLFLAFLLTG
jgi:hypothetical protein